MTWPRFSPPDERGALPHPRYRGVWEERPEIWPDDMPWEVDVDKHDFTERRWLTPAHRVALDAGTLDVPDRVNDHPAVLVSIPANWDTTPVAWVDRGVAEIVYHAARLGAPTAESCENAGHGGGAYGWPDMPMLWFNDRAGLDRFARLVEDASWPGWRWYIPGRFARKRDRVYGIAIPTEDLPAVAQHLRRKGR